MTIALSPVDKSGCQFYFDTRDRTIGERIALDKFEPYLTKLFWEYLKPKMVVVDAGANIGYYSVLAAKKGCMVYAFEPNKYNFEILLKNIKLNKLEDKVKAYNLALGDENKKVKLFLSDTNLGDHRIFEDKKRAYEEVEMVKLDKILENIKIDFLKSDTQGAESQIFKGAFKIIQSFKPTIMFELWQESKQEILYFKFLKNYFFYSIDEYLQLRRKFGDFKGESINVWATKKPLTFLQKYRDFWFKKFVKQILNLSRT